MHLLSVCFLLIVSSSLSAGEAGRIVLGPALVLVRDLQAGAETSLTQDHGAAYQIRNVGGEAVTFEVSVTAPAHYAPRQWEVGYEPLPDATWLQLVHDGQRSATHRLTLPAGAEARLDLIIAVPAGLAWSNRHFMAFVEAGQPSTAAMGAQLRLRSRVMIETGRAEAGPETLTDPLRWEPSRIDMQLQSDGQWLGRARLRWLGTHTIDLIPLARAYPGEEMAKQSRFFSQPLQAAIGETWSNPDRLQFAVSDGGSAVIVFSGQPSVSGTDGEEVWFAARRAAPETEAGLTRIIDGVAYDRFELLRLRYPAAAELRP